MVVEEVKIVWCVIGNYLKSIISSEGKLVADRPTNQPKDGKCFLWRCVDGSKKRKKKKNNTKVER